MSMPIRTECDINLLIVNPFFCSSRPLGFRCTIVPRDDRAKELIIAANMAG